MIVYHCARLAGYIYLYVTYTTVTVTTLQNGRAFTLRIETARRHPGAAGLCRPAGFPTVGFSRPWVALSPPVSPHHFAYQLTVFWCSLGGFREQSTTVQRWHLRSADVEIVVLAADSLHLFVPYPPYLKVPGSHAGFGGQDTTTLASGAYVAQLPTALCKADTGEDASPSFLAHSRSTCR